MPVGAVTPWLPQAMPVSKELYDMCKVPLLAMITPLARTGLMEREVPRVESPAGGPVRCGRCRAYMNPHNKITDGGRSWTCVLCNMSNVTPSDYVSFVDGSRRGADERAELSMGSVEYIAPPAYNARVASGGPAITPTFVFVFDVSYAAVASGATAAALAAARGALPCVPRARAARCMHFRM